MATFNYNKTNLAAASLTSNINSSQTTIQVDAGDAATFPTVPFYATIAPSGKTANATNSEVVEVTANSSGSLTVVRGQRGTSAMSFTAGAIVFNGVYTQDVDYAQAVGKSFFSATYVSSNTYNIDDSRLGTTPSDGDSIRVVFSADHTATTAPSLMLNSYITSAYPIYAGTGMTYGHGTTTTPALVKAGVVYELVYYSGAWYAMNVTANSSITSSNIDWTTSTSTIVTPSANFGFGTIANSRKMHIWNFGPIVMLQGQLQATQDTASGYTEICSFSTDYNPSGGGTLTFMDTTSSSQPIRFDISNGHLYSADRAYSNGEIVRLALVWHK